MWHGNAVYTGNREGKARLGGRHKECTRPEERECVGSRSRRVTEGRCGWSRDGGGVGCRGSRAGSDLVGPRQELDYLKKKGSCGLLS